MNTTGTPSSGDDSTVPAGSPAGTEPGGPTPPSTGHGPGQPGTGSTHGSPQTAHGTGPAYGSGPGYGSGAGSDTTGAGYGSGPGYGAGSGYGPGAGYGAGSGYASSAGYGAGPGYGPGSTGPGTGHSQPGWGHGPAHPGYCPGPRSGHGPRPMPPRYGPGPQPIPSYPSQRESTSGFFDSLRRTGIWRSEDRWIGGVAAGVARRFDVDPLLIRGIFVVMTLFGGLGLLLYGVGWALLPEESDGRIHLQEAIRGNFDAALAGAIAFAIIGISSPATWWGGWDSGYWGGGWFLASLAILGLVALLLVGLARRGRHDDPSAAPGRGRPAGPGAPYPGAPGAGPGGSAPYAGGPTAPYGAPSAAPSTAAPSATYAAAPTSAPTGRTAGTDAPPWRGVGGPAGRTAPASSDASGYDGGRPPAGPSYGPTYGPPPQRPPVPPHPRTPGPGQAVVAVVLALSLLAAATLLLLDRTASVGWLTPLMIGGSVLALLGAGTMIAGARGRRGGVLAVLGVLLAIVVVPGTFAGNWFPGGVYISDAPVGDRSVTPSTPTEAEAGYRQGAGDLDVDLRELDLSGPPVTVPIEIGAGDLTIVLPDDVSAVVRAQVGAGRVEGLVQPGWEITRDDSGFGGGSSDTATRQVWADGVGLDIELASPGASPDPDLILEINAGTSTVEIRQASTEAPTGTDQTTPADEPTSTDEPTVTDEPTTAPGDAGTATSTTSATETVGHQVIVGPEAVFAAMIEEQS